MALWPTPTMATVLPPVPIVEEIKVKVIEEVKVECSCIKGARRLGVSIPWGTNAVDLVASSTPQIGGLAIFSYKNDDHTGVILDWRKGGFLMGEENFRDKETCLITYRFIAWDDPYLRGFATY